MNNEAEINLRDVTEILEIADYDIQSALDSADSKTLEVIRESCTVLQSGDRQNMESGHMNRTHRMVARDLIYHLGWDEHFTEAYVVQMNFKELADAIDAEGDKQKLEQVADDAHIRGLLRPQDPDLTDPDE